VHRVTHVDRHRRAVADRCDDGRVEGPGAARLPAYRLALVAADQPAPVLVVGVAKVNVRVLLLGLFF
jgi:hypothetical protein